MTEKYPDRSSSDLCTSSFHCHEKRTADYTVTALDTLANSRQTHKSIGTNARSNNRLRCRQRSVQIVFGVVMALALPVVLAASEAKPVKILKLGDENAEVTRSFFGRVTAKQSVDLAFQVAGQVVEYPAVEGELIEQGSLIARLDQEPFQLGLDRAMASKRQADRTLARLEQLQGMSASRASVEDARTAAEIASVAVRDAEYALSRTTLRAPFAALVASRSLANFSTIDAGSPIVRLHDMSELQIEIDVPEVLFQRIGNDPNLTLVARFPASDTLYPIEFREVNAEASRIGQTFKVTLGMPPPADLLLFPGASVTVIATLLDAPSGLHVPSTALYKELDGSVALLRFDNEGYGSEGSITKIPVQIRISENGEVQVLSGIAPGSEIVVSGVDTLSDGQSVSRFGEF
jgi:RND family efflux transporter MFP subunit